VDFPDRFIIGSDQHYPSEGLGQRWQTVVLLFNQLPADVRRKIGTEMSFISLLEVRRACCKRIKN